LHPRHAHDHGGGHEHGEHGNSHGLIHDSVRRSREGIRAVSLSLAVLGVTACAQTAVFLAGGSIALLADLIHNFGGIIGVGEISSPHPR
jgi:Co/Zn/Cd efflux system component